MGISQASGNLALYKITSGAVSHLYKHKFSTARTRARALILSETFIFRSAGNQIYRYATNRILSVFAGSGKYGYADGNGIFTAFSNPTALAADTANNIYVWDSGDYLIRKIDQSQNVTTLAGKYQNFSNADGVGTNTVFGSISQMCVDGSGNLILACGTPASEKLMHEQMW